MLCSSDAEPLEPSDFSITKSNQKKLINELSAMFFILSIIMVNLSGSSLRLDKDVLVLLISYVGWMENINPDIEIYAYLTARKKYYNIAEIAKMLVEGGDRGAN